MFLWANRLITLYEFIMLKRGVICIIWFGKQDTTLWRIVKSRKMVNPWRSWNKHVNLASCSSINGNFLNLFFSVYIFNIKYNVIRTSIPYLHYKFIVTCYYNKSLVSKKWLKIIVLELCNKCIVLEIINVCTINILVP